MGTWRKYVFGIAFAERGRAIFEWMLTCLYTSQGQLWAQDARSKTSTQSGICSKLLVNLRTGIPDHRIRAPKAHQALHYLRYALGPRNTNNERDHR